MHRDAVVVLSPAGAISDAWQVAWAGAKKGWRATVPVEQTHGFDVHFDAALAGATELTFRSGAGWLSVRLGEKSSLRGGEATARLHACRLCLEQAPRASEIGGPVYSLKACEMATSVIRATCRAGPIKQ